MSKRKQLCTARENKSLRLMVRIISTEQPEQATMSAFIDATDRSLDKDPSSPVGSEDGSPLRPM